MSPARSAFRGRALRALLILQLVYFFSFVDRQILGILAMPIKADLRLTDTELGLLGGLAFAVFYTGFGIPIGWLADRVNRVRIVATALLMWSGFTALSAFTQGFAQLFLCRMLVGVGEAGGGGPSSSIVSDTFPRRDRGRAIGILLIGIPLGSATGILVGGLVADWLDWRTAFLVVGAAGVLLVPIVWFGVPEPVRGGQDGVGPPAPAGLAATLADLGRRPTFWLVAFAASANSTIGYGNQFWLPSVFQRSYGLSLRETAMYFGSVVLVGGVIGVTLGGHLADRLALYSLRAYALVPATACVMCALLYTLALTSPTLGVAWPLLTLAYIMSYASLAPGLTIVHNVTHPAMRALATASFQLVNNLVGLTVGLAAIGMLSDWMTQAMGPDGLRWATLAGQVFNLLAATLYFVASLFLARDWNKSSE